MGRPNCLQDVENFGSFDFLTFGCYTNTRALNTPVVFGRPETSIFHAFVITPAKNWL